MTQRPIQIHLLLIDDEEDDRFLFSSFYEQEFAPGLYIDGRSSVPDNPVLLKAFDGIVLDYYIRGERETGLDIARRIHEDNWRHPPIFLLTGHDAIVAEDVYDCVDYVASKNDPAQCSLEMRRFVRWLARIRHIKEELRKA